MKMLTVDSSKRVRIPDAKPKEVFAYELDDSGRVTLTPVARAQPNPAKLIRRGGRTYLVNNQPITNEDVQRAMADFP